MTVANILLVWGLVKRQTLCWVATLLMVIGVGGIVMSSPQLSWPRFALLVACTSFSLGAMWYAHLRKALQIAAKIGTGVVQPASK
jgi:hypothetical protein